MKNIMKKILLVSLIVITLASCIEQPPVPKPKTYLRLGTPEPQYVLFRDQTMPFEFEYPDYGKIIPIKSDLVLRLHFSGTAFLFFEDYIISSSFP